MSLLCLWGTPFTTCGVVNSTHSASIITLTNLRRILSVFAGPGKPTSEPRDTCKGPKKYIDEAPKELHRLQNLAKTQFQ